MKHIRIAIISLAFCVLSAGWTSSPTHAQYKPTFSMGMGYSGPDGPGADPVIMNVLNSYSNPFPVPQGSESLTVTFYWGMGTIDDSYDYVRNYPNDWGMVGITSNDVAIYEIRRTIGSTLVGWEPGGTGVHTDIIDLSNMTAHHDINLTFNIQFWAQQGLSGSRILGWFAEVDKPFYTNIAISVDRIDTKNDGSYYSVPALGESNYETRYFTVSYNKPAGSTITGVAIDLLGDGQVLRTNVTSAAPMYGDDVEVLESTDTFERLRVRASIKGSTTNGIPPPARNLEYAVTISGQDKYTRTFSGSGDVRGRRALWRMPAAIARYGARDPGGDNWIAKGAYEWMERNSSKLTQVDDVSGEHGLNIGHVTHQFGTDIDMYHYYRFRGAVTGDDNYRMLSSHLSDAFGVLSAPAPGKARRAYESVRSWIVATRRGLDGLVELDDVTQVIYALGSATDGLKNGWTKDLITRGVVTRNVGGVSQVLDFGVGAWSAKKISYRTDHNSHIHITLDRSKIGE